MNPVWKRELRARWRGWRAFALVFFMVLVLSVAFTWQYGESIRTSTDYYGSDFDPRQRLSRLGRELFSLLAWLQLGLWMLLAPVLTATAIVQEREKGLLEGLQLSRLRAGEIVVGKLLSSLSLIALLIVVTLPISATCFLMGGVSPGEFLLVLALHFATAIGCAAIGLAVSAWCRNSIAAIVLSLVSICVWSGLAFLSVIIAFGRLSRTFTPPSWPWNQIGELLAKAHPATPMLEAANFYSGSTNIPWTTSTPSWIVSLIFMAIFTAVCLLIAAWGTRRISINSFRVDWKILKAKLHVTDAANLNAPETIPRELSPKTKLNQKPNSKRWELGALAKMEFSNPILGREVRACFRPRSTSIAMLILAGVLAPLAACAYLWGLYWIIADSFTSGVIGPLLLGAHLILTILLCSITSASGFSREREGATWEALRLSLLSPREILWGKMGAPLMICATCGLVFLPLILPCIRSLVYYDSYQIKGISLTQFLASMAIIAASAWCFTLIGLLISNFCKRSVTAICATLGVLLITLVGVPMYLISFYVRLQYEELLIRHPFFALVALFDRRTSYNSETPILTSTLGTAFPCVFLLIAIGTICFLVLWRELNFVKERKSR